MRPAACSRLGSVKARSGQFDGDWLAFVAVADVGAGLAEGVVPEDDDLDAAIDGGLRLPSGEATLTVQVVPSTLAW